MLLKDSERHPATVAAYMDLNPIRVVMAEDSAEYRWSGYEAAVHGVAPAQAGLKRMVMGGLSVGATGLALNGCLDSP
jgi:hypothetical protein